MRPMLSLAAITAVLVVATSRPAPSQGFDTPRTFRLVEATIPELVAALETHQINSKQLVKLYIDRIAAYEGTLNAMIRVNPTPLPLRMSVISSAPTGTPADPCTAFPSSSRTTCTRST